MDPKEQAHSAINAQRSALLKLSHQLHERPELAFAETQSAAAVAAPLGDGGFDVEMGVADMPTAFRATFGSGPLHVGICAEYDALPSIGHACGHNVIAAAAVGAALGLAAVADEVGLTVVVLGTPAEEDGGGKIHMLQRGTFDGLHAAMMVHGYAKERDAMGTLAVSQLDVRYTGRPAHAAAHPEQGVNAAAALTLAQNGIALLREHILETDRVHGIVVKGGDAPNIVPASTFGRWFVRSRRSEDLQKLEPRIIDVFRGAAMMTGCTVEIVKSSPTYTELQTDERMASRWRANMATLGRDSLPLQPGDSAASTDMGNVSFAVPTIHPLIAIDADGANIHEQAFADHAAGPSADAAAIDGAVAMAWTAIDLALDGELSNALQQAPYAVSSVRNDDNAYLGYGWDEPITFDPKDQ